MLFWCSVMFILFCNSSVYCDKDIPLLSDRLRENSQNVLNFEGKIYYYSTVFKGNYFQATQFCNKHGMQLVSITSKEENDRLGEFAEQIGMNSSHFWTSGTNLQEDNSDEWIWLSIGSAFTYTNWYPGEPNKRPDKPPENCMEARIVDYRGLSWNNAPCKFLFYFICETYSSKCNIS